MEWSPRNGPSPSLTSSPKKRAFSSFDGQLEFGNDGCRIGGDREREKREEKGKERRGGGRRRETEEEVHTQVKA